ncbi:MAG TPA: hypothetical protein VGV63_02805 [Acidimicrobiales bacterium]|nr:hypothetical protein [Acidimicrobiales bacterium]
MSGLVFLVVALLLSVVGSVALWLRHREPTSVERSVDDFSREMNALAPHHRPGAERSRPERRA